MSKKQKIEFLVLKPMTLEIYGNKLENIHDKGKIFLSYYDFKDALAASKNNKYQIFEITQANKSILAKKENKSK